MKNRYLNRTEMYGLLVKAIENKLKEDKKPISYLTSGEFGVSERQFYYLKKNMLGYKTPNISEKKLKDIAERFGYEVEVRFRVNRKGD